VIGAAIEVHRELGPGFLEQTYEQALCIELANRGVAAEQQLVIPILYKSHRLSDARLDLLLDDELVVEIKAVETLLPIHRAQLISYLKAGAFQLGLLINFNVQLLKDGICRVIWNS